MVHEHFNGLKLNLDQKDTFIHSVNNTPGYSTEQGYLLISSIPGGPKKTEQSIF